MNSDDVAKIIKNLRLENNLTQKELADKMNISDKTVSKWERGLGLPDILLLNELSGIFKIDLQKLLNGEIKDSERVGGNMKNTKYYVCPICNNISLCSGNATVSCCGRKLESLELKKASAEQKLKVEVIEDDYFINSEHIMSKDDYISFVALVTGDNILFYKQYPQWNLQLRIPRRKFGKLIYYSTTEGLFYQILDK